jgi:hypothetical protein
VVGRVVIVVLAVVLTACRVDVTVDVAMNENGSGTLTVAAIADADVVTAAPGLAEDIRTDDLVTAGWAVEAPTPTATGGLAFVLTHDFDTPEQATALLASLNGPQGPLQAIAVSRAATEREITYTVSGTGRLDGGLSAFADADLLAAVGGTPYVEQIAAAGVVPTDAVGITLRTTTPGSASTSSGIPVETGDASNATIEWVVPMDGTPVAVSATTVKSLERGGVWNLGVNLARIAFFAWIAVSIVVIGFVIRARRRHRSTRRYLDL